MKNKFSKFKTFEEFFKEAEKHPEYWKERYELLKQRIMKNKKQMKQLNSLNFKKAKPLNLSQYLKKRSKEICADNHCTEDQHNCESYAYINKNYQLMDICYPDYFQGSSSPYAAIPLPWNGTMKELKQEVRNQILEQTTKEKIELINNKDARYIPTGSAPLTFNVEILDCREAFGRTDCLIKPKDGTGEKWVSLDSLKLFNKF